MIDKPDSSHTLGLELQGKNLKMVQLSLIKGKPKLIRLFEFEIDQENNLKTQFEKTNTQDIESDDVKRLYIAKHDFKDLDLERLTNTNLVSTCLNGTQTIVRSLEIKLKKERDIIAALPYQVEPILPFSYENGVVDKINVDQTADGTSLTILAARKDIIKQHIESFQNIQIEPEVITSESSALVSFANHFVIPNPVYFIIYFANLHITCSLVKNGKLIASQTCFLKSGLENTLEIHVNDVTRILYALSKQTRGVDVKDVLYLGDVVKNKNLVTSLELKLNKNSCSLQPDLNFDLSTVELQKFAIPLGLALNTLQSTENRINFRQEELSFPNPWKHLKKPLGIYLVLGALLAVSFHFFGQAYLNVYEDEIKTEYVALLGGMNKPYSEFENEYFLKFPSEAKNEYGEITPIIELSQNDINNRLNFLYKELQSSPESFPLFPNVPRVSDVLGWLSNHPNVVEKDDLNDTKNPLIQLESFSYTMLKRPDQTKKQEKYQVKVEFEFNTATPKLAREFHDALIAPNEIVDPKGEVKWSSNRGKYKTSFFLKDKTIYPSTRL